MSLDFDIAPYCKGKRCTNKLTSRVEYENNLCDLCMYELEKKWDAEKEERKRDDEKK